MVAKNDAIAQKKVADEQRNIAVVAKNDAIAQKKVADEQRNIRWSAVVAKNDAIAQKKVADEQRDIAKQNEDKANKAKADALARKQEAERQRQIAETQTVIARQNEEKAVKATQKEVYGALYRPHRPGGRQDRRQRLRSRPRTAGGVPAGVPQLGMGPALLPLHPRQPHDRRRRSRRGAGLLARRLAIRQRRLGRDGADLGRRLGPQAA